MTNTKILILLFTLFHGIIQSTYAQTIRKKYDYSNFDGSNVKINLILNGDFVQESNKNWYEVGRKTSNINTNYFNRIESLFIYNKDSLKFVYDMFDNFLSNVSDEYFINTVIRFVQTIPYKIPPADFNGKKTGGVFPPAICLSEGYGDCDTKSLLLCCILGHKYQLIFLMGPKHAFVGVKIEPQENQEYVEINGEKFVLCELTDKWDLGKLPVSSIDDINNGKYQYRVLNY
jgi:hypothetical protein